MERKEPLPFPPSLPPIPDHLTGITRDLFIKIVEEMADARIDMKPVDTILVEMLAVKLALVHGVRIELQSAGAKQAVLRPMETGYWALALDAAKDLLLPQEALERMLKAFHQSKEGSKAE